MMDARGLRDQAKMLRKDAQRHRETAERAKTTMGYRELMDQAQALETRAIELEAEARRMQPGFWRRALRLEKGC